MKSLMINLFNAENEKESLLAGSIGAVEGNTNQDESFTYDSDENTKMDGPVEWIPIKPYGLSIGSNADRPLLLFKDFQEKHTLPVPLHPLEAGLSLVQSSQQRRPHSPHAATKEIFNFLGLRLIKCYFSTIRGSHLMANLEFAADNALAEKLLKEKPALLMRAQNVMSFCLDAGAEFFTTKEIIKKSAVLNYRGELEPLDKELFAILTKSNQSLFH